MKSFIYKIPFYQYSKTKLFAWCKQAFVLEYSTQTFKSRSQDCCLQSFVDWKNPCQTCAKDRNCFNSACIKIIAQVFGRFLNIISKVLCYLEGTSLYFALLIFVYSTLKKFIDQPANKEMYLPRGSRIYKRQCLANKVLRRQGVKSRVIPQKLDCRLQSFCQAQRCFVLKI